ncbi:hypothetical protein LCGC14_2039180, partial [marine sediment metagenome]
WRTDREFMTFDGIEYRSCAEGLLNKYPGIYLCYERDKYYEVFGREFGVCSKRTVPPIDRGPFWDEYRECVKSLNRKGIYDKPDMREKKRSEGVTK